MSAERRVPIESDVDIVSARQAGREVASALGFGAADTTLIATAISEIARNIVDHAGRGEVVVSEVEEGGRRGIEVVARDEGAGIADVEAAMRDGFSTGKGLGLGLPGARRMMHEFAIVSEVGKGTKVTMKKWAPKRP